MSEVEKNKLFEKITAALQRSAKKAWLEHKLKNQPIAVSDKNGNVHWISANNIQI